MRKVSVTAQPRQAAGSARCRKLRHEGFVPAVVYGRTLQPTPLQLARLAAVDMVRQGQRMVDLTTPSGTQKVFIRDIQYDATSDNIVHIDFNQVALDEMLTLEVAVEITGKPVGVTADGGVLTHYVKHVSVRCLPDAIPEKLVSDVSHLKLDDHLLVKELKPPAGVTIITAEDIVVAGVRLPLVEEVAPAAAEAGPAEPELIGRKPAEEEGEEGAEAKPAKKEKAPEEKEGKDKK